MPCTEHGAFGGLPLICTASHYFRTHGPRIRIGGISAFPGILIVRVSASVATTEGSPGRGSILLAADKFIPSVSAIPIEGGTGSVKALAAATAIAQPTYISRCSTQETAPAATTGSTVSVSAMLCTPAPPPWTTRRPTATAMGNAPPLYIMDSGPAGPLGHIAKTKYNTAASPTAAAGSACCSDPCSCHSPVRTVPLPSDRDHAEPIWELLSYGSRLLLVTRRLHMQGRTLSSTLMIYGSLILPRVIHMPIGSESSTLGRRATP